MMKYVFVVLIHTCGGRQNKHNNTGVEREMTIHTRSMQMVVSSDSSFVVAEELDEC
jgi:hypothetical protein